MPATEAQVAIGSKAPRIRLPTRKPINKRAKPRKPRTGGKSPSKRKRADQTSGGHESEGLSDEYEGEAEAETEADAGDERKPKPKRRKVEKAELVTSEALIGFQHSGDPPPAVSLSTAQAVRMSSREREDWASEAGGQSAARRGAEFDVLRLIGSARLDLSMAGGKAPLLAKSLGLLKKQPALRPADKKWGWDRGKGRQSSPPMEAWERSSGEVVGQGFVSPADLLRCLYSGSLLCEQEWATELLEAVGTLTQPDQALWGCPLLRCIIVPPAELPTPSKTESAASKRTSTSAAPEDAAPSSDAASTSATSPEPSQALSSKALGKQPVSRAASKRAAAKSVVESPKSPGELRLDVHVYVSRLLLYMIAHPAIRIVLDRLTAPRNAPVLPCDALPDYPPTFRCHGGANAQPFSLEGVLKMVEHTGYRVEPQPEGLALTLKPYQAQALAWMLDMENLPRGINGLFWEVSATEQPTQERSCLSAV